MDMPDRLGNGITDVVSRAIVGAPLNAVGKSVADLLEHPLITLAREYYPGKKVERDSALVFFREQLRALGVKSEDECPASDLDLPDWVDAGLRYGCRLKAEEPKVVGAIFQECEASIEGTLRVARRIVNDAEGKEPWRLVQILKRWQQSAFGWVEPQFYGEELARAVYFADFAIWIAWATDGAPG